MFASKMVVLSFMAIAAYFHVAVADYCDAVKDADVYTLTGTVEAGSDEANPFPDQLGNLIDGAFSHPEDPSSPLAAPAGPNSLEDRKYTVFVGFQMGSTCDYNTGLMEPGHGKLACVAYCRDHFRDQPACDASVCFEVSDELRHQLRWDAKRRVGNKWVVEGAKKDESPRINKTSSKEAASTGMCYCTCGCPGWPRAAGSSDGSADVDNGDVVDHVE